MDDEELDHRGPDWVVKPRMYFIGDDDREQHQIRSWEPPIGTYDRNNDHPRIVGNWNPDMDWH